MRVYFVGGHSTGKTTLARAVAKQLGLPLINEVARALLNEVSGGNFHAIRTDLDAVNQYQRGVFERQLLEEERLPGGFVSDRSFDNLAYAAEHSSVLPDILHSEQFRLYVEKVRLSGIVFFVRPHLNLIMDDGIRAGADRDSILRIDGMVKLLLATYRIEHINITGDNFQERVNDVLTVIRLAQRQTRI